MKLVDYSDDEDSSRRVMFLSKGERSKVLEEGSGLSPTAPELDSAMGVGRRIDLSKVNYSEQSKLLTKGSGSALATLELDSTMGVGSRIDLSREGSDEVAYRQLKELLDEPSSSDSKRQV